MPFTKKDKVLMRKGGKNTAKRLGREYMRLIGSKGGKKSGKVRAKKLSPIED